MKEGHLAYFIRDVVGELYLSAIYADYRSRCGPGKLKLLWKPRPARSRVKKTIKRKIGYRKLPVSLRRSLTTARSTTLPTRTRE